MRNRRKSVVALLAEGVDRNFYITQITNADWTVALLAEGVDRNHYTDVAASQSDRSPSSRRAWIEILRWTTLPDYQAVALLAEGVDRNIKDFVRSFL